MVAKPNGAVKLRGLTQHQIQSKTQERKAQILAAYAAEGTTLSSAAHRAGVDLAQIRRWRRADPEFRAALEKLERSVAA